MGNFIAIALTKLTMKTRKQLRPFGEKASQSIIILCQLLRGHEKKDCDPESRQRMRLCLKLLMNPGKASFQQIEELLLKHSRRILALYLEDQSDFESKLQQKKAADLQITQPDEPIVFRQLKPRAEVTDFDMGEEIGSNIEDLINASKKETEMYVYQLTGYSDQIYAEAFLEVHHFDILMKIVLTNRTNKTLPNVQVELLTQGNLKAVEKPQP